MEDLVDNFIEMNTAGLVLELCEKHYDENVVMLNNGDIFAESMREAYNKQERFVSLIVEFEVTFISKKIEGVIAELVFHYKMTDADKRVMDFTGKHVQTWDNNKIVREEYLSI
jgi:hypothetical protein